MTSSSAIAYLNTVLGLELNSYISYIQLLPLLLTWNITVSASTGILAILFPSLIQSLFISDTIVKDNTLSIVLSNVIQFYGILLLNESFVLYHLYKLIYGISSGPNANKPSINTDSIRVALVYIFALRYAATTFGLIKLHAALGINLFSLLNILLHFSLSFCYSYFVFHRFIFPAAHNNKSVNI
jgi:hypothetical protein